MEPLSDGDDVGPAPRLVATRYPFRRDPTVVDEAAVEGAPWPSDSEAAATTDEQTADLKKANEIIANDAASDWLYLYPQIVVSSSKVTGYPVNGLNSQFFVYGIKKAK